MSTVPGRAVSRVNALERPGDFFIEQNEAEKILGVATLFYKCPCGCNGRHQFSSDSPAFELIYIRVGPKEPGYWQWDGSLTRPTLSPSIWAKKENGGCGWHGFLEEGSWRTA